jgi:hypothetical protein
MNPTEEFDRQVQNLIQKGYPKAANLSDSEFLKLLTPLKKQVEQLTSTEVDIEKGKLPFVIVVKSSLVDTETAMTKVEWNGKPGTTKLFPHLAPDFQTKDFVKIPESQVYLLIDIDRGEDTINVRPQDALIEIQNQNSSPLTIDEGVALVTQFPSFLIKNHCFSLLASRIQGNQRVPAIWINGNKQPNLGWCWDGNPHTWLGSASAKDRI